MASSLQGGDYRQVNWENVNIRYERRYLNIDARMRDPISDPDTANFRYALPEIYRNVAYAKLISAEIPVTDFNVNESNNIFTLVDDGVTYNVEIPPCDYDINTFIATVQNLVNTLTTPVPPTNAYSFSVECGKLVIEGNGGTQPFQLLFRTGFESDQIVPIVFKGHSGPNQIIKNRSAREVMGFDIADYTSDGNNQIRAPYKVDLTGETYLTLKVFTDGGNSFDAYDAPDQSSDGAFFIIPLTAPRNSINYITNQYLNIQKTFPTPLNKVSQLRFQFLGYYGRQYNFQGHSPALQLELGTLI